MTNAWRRRPSSSNGWTPTATGLLSAEEYAGAAALHEMDADKDGIIERAEYNAHKEAKQAAKSEG